MLSKSAHPNGMKNFFKQLFCKHRWHKVFNNSSVNDENWYQHGYYACQICGKIENF
jgi:hypothetical protein